MPCFNTVGIPSRTRGATLIEIMRKLIDAPVEERNIQDLATDRHLIEFGLFHPERSTGRAPIVVENVEEEAQGGEKVEAEVGEEEGVQEEDDKGEEEGEEQGEEVEDDMRMRAPKSMRTVTPTLCSSAITPLYPIVDFYCYNISI